MTSFGVMMTTALMIALFFLMMPILLIGLALWKHATAGTKTKRWVWRMEISNAVFRAREILTLPTRKWQNWLARVTGARSRVRLANIAEGVRENSMAVYTDAAITARHLLYKKGTANDHVAAAGALDTALGTIDDLAAAAEELKTLFLLGKGTRTKRMVANGAITIYTPVYQAAGGKVAPTGFRCVGIAIKAASADTDIIEVIDVQAVLGTGFDTLINTAVAAAGTTVADAGQLGNARVVRITSDGATKGVKLPTGVAGMRMTVVNNSATAAELYAATGGTINGAAANASMVIAASKGVECICTGADTWLAFDLTALATAS